MTRGVSVIETDAVESPGSEDSSIREFFEADELDALRATEVPG